MATSKAVAKKSETAVAGESIKEWMVAQVEPADLKEVLEANGGEEGFGPRDLEIIKVPSGGGTMWEYPTADGKDGGRYFDAIILHQHTHRKVWTRPYGSGQAGPPDCTSDDGLFGIGSPGGACAQCPLNRVKEQDEEITCSPRKNVFLLLPDLAIPVLLDLPVTSVRIFDDYLKKELTPRLKMPWRVMTRFELVADKARRGGQPYAKLVISRVADIPKEEWGVIEGYREAFVQPLEESYAARKQVRQELTQGVSGQQNLWDSGPEVGIDDEDDDLPEIGDGDLTPTSAQKEMLTDLLMRQSGGDKAYVESRLLDVETRREASELISELKADMS